MLIRNFVFPDVPESTAISSLSSTSTTITVTFSTDSATSQSTSTQPTSTGVGAAVGSDYSHSDPKGPLIGGIVGGVLGLLLIGALIFYILLRHRRLTGAPHAQPDSEQVAPSAEATISRSGTPGPYGHATAPKERMMSPTDSVVYVRMRVLLRSNSRSQVMTVRVSFGRTRMTRVRSRRGWGLPQWTAQWTDICARRALARGTLRAWGTVRAWWAQYTAVPPRCPREREARLVAITVTVHMAHLCMYMSG